MNIGLDHYEPIFLRVAAHASQSVFVPGIAGTGVRVVELVDTPRCERGALGHAGSSPAAHNGR